MVAPLGRFSIAFTANGRSDHVTMFSPRLPLNVCRFQMKVSSFALFINTRIIFLYFCIFNIYFEKTKTQISCLPFAVSVMLDLSIVVYKKTLIINNSGNHITS